MKLFLFLSHMFQPYLSDLFWSKPRTSPTPFYFCVSCGSRSDFRNHFPTSLFLRQNHDDGGLHDGPEAIPAGRAELHSGNWKLYVSSLFCLVEETGADGLTFPSLKIMKSAGSLIKKTLTLIVSWGRRKLHRQLNCSGFMNLSFVGNITGCNPSS